MNKAGIFISYSHADERWKGLLLQHLSVLMRENMVEIWDDRRIAAGQEWRSQVDEAILNASVAILLVSSDFLTSDLILGEEVPRLLQRRQEEGLVVLPIIVRPCDWVSVRWLASMQVYPRDGRPLSTIDNPDRALVELVTAIRDIVEASQKSRPSARVTAKKRVPAKGKPRSVDVFISHSNDDGDFAELLQRSIADLEMTSWVDVDRLKPGVDWRHEIDEAIRNARCLIVVMTPMATESEYVTYEWAFAAGAGIKVIPLMLKRTELHPRLESLQFLDFTNRRARPWEVLFEELQGLSGNKKSRAKA